MSRKATEVTMNEWGNGNEGELIGGIRKRREMSRNVDIDIKGLSAG